ncbi:hypothetical protein GCM10029964_031870 [Kibdelosporangium lantanae]
MELTEALALIRQVPDFPEPGVVFQDITPVLGDAAAFRAVVDAMAATLDDVDALIAVDARGFFFGAAVAYSVASGWCRCARPASCPWSVVTPRTRWSTGPPSWRSRRT